MIGATIAVILIATFTMPGFAQAQGVDSSGSTQAAPSMPLTYNAAPARGDRNRLRIHLNGGQLELLDNNTGTVLTSQSFENTSSVIVNGSSSDDTLMVDFTGGNPIPAGGLTFNGGNQVTPEGDILEIHGGSFQWAVYDYYNAHDGRVSLDDSIINYTGLEPLTNIGTAADVTFNLPAGTVGASLQDDGTVGNSMVQLASTNATFATTTFAVPTTSLTVNAGGGTDTITTAANFSGDFNAKLTINGTQATDAVTLNTLTLGNAGANPGTLTVTAHTISVSGVANTSAGTAPNVVLTAGTSITVNSINAGSSGDVTLTAGGTATGLITSVSPSNSTADVTGRTVTLAASGPSNGNSGQIGFFTSSAQFFEVAATTINATTNNSRAWISAIGGAALGSINVGSNRVFLRTVNGNLTSTHTGASPDVTAAIVDFSVSGNGGAFGSSSNPLLLQATTLQAGVTGIGSSFSATNVPAGGNLTGNSISTTNGGDINLTVAGGSFITAAGLASSGGNITLSADDMIINNSINAGSGIVTLKPVSPSRPIDLGTNTAGRLGLTNAELGLVSAATALRIGATTNTGGIFVTSQITAPAGYSTLHLITGNAIFDGTATEQADLIVPKLALETAFGIGSVNSIDVAGPGGASIIVAFKNTGSSAQIAELRTASPGGLTIGSVDGLTTSTNTGTTTTLTAASPLAFAVNTTGTGDFTVSAIDNNGGAGDDITVSTGVTVQATGGGLTFNAGDNINLLTGSVTKASGSVSLNIGFLDTDGQSSATIQGTIMGTSPTVTGGSANDALLIDFTNGALLPNGLDYDGGPGASNALTISDQGGANPHSYTFDATAAVRDGTTINYSNTQNVMATGGNGNDTFTVTPSSTTAFNITGGPPSPPASPGDTLNVDTTGTTNPSLTALSSASGFSGFYTFGNRKSVLFQEIEVLNPPPPSPTPTATATATATPTATASPTSSPTPASTATPTATPNPTSLANISTRLRVETGDDVLIGGFIVTGTEPKKIIALATGPSLTALGVPGVLANPTLELFQGSTLLDSNDNWVDSPNKQAIIDSGVAPTNDLESAIVAILPAFNGQYTAVVRGANNGTGVGTVQLFDLDRTVDSKLANISTRGLVQTGDNVLIAGTIVLGQTSQKIIVRAIGPSLTVPGKLADPTLELRDGNGVLLDANDNWIDSPDKQAIIDSTVPPTNDLESAIVATLSSGGAQYTAIVRGVDNATGIGVVEIYALQ